jgi:hypothetical protein
MLLVIVFNFGILTACTAKATEPLPTSTKTPSPFPSPTATEEPEPAEEDDLLLVEPVTLSTGGFSFLPPIVLRATYTENQVSMSNIDQTVMFIIVSNPIDTDKSLIDSMESFLSNIEMDLEESVVTDSYTTEVAGASALTTDISGILFGENITGRITLVDPGNTRRILAFIIVMDPPTGPGWESEGELVYTAVMDSIEFFEPTAAAGDACVVSTDPSYGYTEDNPIRVGGQAFGGPARERAYLDTLLGPSGEEITYFRQGSVDGIETILDVYKITYEGLDAPITLYLDEYAFETLFAPVGFTCSGPFPIQEP